MAKTHDPENERIKRAYTGYLRDANQLSEPSIDAALKAIARFEAYTKCRNFKAFHIEQAKGFKRHLAEQKAFRSSDPLSKATQASTLNALKAFFKWLAGRPGYKSKIAYADAEYFNLSQHDASVARAINERPVPTLEQLQRVVSAMPDDTVLQRRDRAIVAFIVLTGARDAAVASARLKHVDLREGRFIQDAREVKTKFRKSFSTWFFPVDDAMRVIVEEWIAYLRRDALFGDNDPVFPKTEIIVGAESRQFEAAGLSREPWSNATAIRKVFKGAFEALGLPYCHPHSVRKTLARFGQQMCQNAEEMKSWSQNLGHDDVLTTFMSYGAVPEYRQAELIRNMGKPSIEQDNLVPQLKALLDRAQRSQANNQRGMI